MVAALSSVIMALCGVFILLNWAGLVHAMVRKRGHSFAPPFLCGILGFFAALAHPDALVNHFSWVYLVADPSMLALAAILLKSSRRKIQRIK